MLNGKLIRCMAAYTLIELMIVMAILALLMTIVVPRYFDGLQRSKETALKQNLKEMREAIEQYHADKGAYPTSIQTLVSEKYLRFIPIDPETERTDTWQFERSQDEDKGIEDVHSGAQQQSRQGTPYSEW